MDRQLQIDRQKLKRMVYQLVLRGLINLHSIYHLLKIIHSFIVLSFLPPMLSGILFIILTCPLFAKFFHSFCLFFSQILFLNFFFCKLEVIFFFRQHFFFSFLFIYLLFTLLYPPLITLLYPALPSFTLCYSTLPYFYYFTIFNVLPSCFLLLLLLSLILNLGFCSSCNKCIACGTSINQSI